MSDTLWSLLQGLLLTMLFAIIYLSIRYLLLSVWPTSRLILPFQRLKEMLARQRKYRMLRSLRLVPREESSLEEMRGLLTACGWSIDVMNYTAVKRSIVLLSTLILCSAYLGWDRHWVDGMLLVWVMVVAGGCLLLVCCDKLILRALREQRRARIVQDVQAISSQLLYYKRSRLNLHGQLQRCVPLASYIRKEMQLLVNEWYEGSHEAIRRFRDRLATDEAVDFAETLHALHLYGSDRYYDLLEERIRSYKEKLALIREGRKEATSYVLFLLSGIPIMYTFLIFIYPWIAESRYLFDSLG